MIVHEIIWTTLEKVRCFCYFYLFVLKLGNIDLNLLKGCYREK